MLTRFGAFSLVLVATARLASADAPGIGQPSAGPTGEPIVGSATADDEPGPARVQWGIGATGGVAGVTAPNTAANFGVGADFRLGYAANDLLGFEGEVSGSVAFLSGVVRGALLVDLTPVRSFTVALGAMTSYGGGSNDTIVSGGTARIDFHLGSRRTHAGARRGFTVGLGADLGFGRATDLAENGLGWGANVYMGYAHY